MTRFYVTGGTLQRDAPSYIQRRADQDLYVGLTQGRFCYVLTSRQMGKSSLMVRTATRLRDEGVAVGVLDLTAIGQNVTAAQWYAGLLGLIGQQLDLEDELEEFWLSHDRIGPLQRWMRGIREVVLHRYDSRLVIFVDEIDTVRSLPFSTDEFFAAIREFYNHRTEDAELARLTFCLLGVATPAELIRDTRTTPFNIGQRVELIDFTEAEAATLAQGLGREESLNISLLKRILYWTGGHPYLTQRLCQAVAEDQGVTSAQGMDRLCEALFLASRAREQDDNLLFVRERILRSEVDLTGLLALYAQVHSQKPVRDDDTNPLISILRLSGITHVVGGFLYVRNRIYYRVFDLEWVRQIEKEIRSQAEEREKQKQPAPKPKRFWQAVLASGIGAFLLALAGYVALPRLTGGAELLVLSEPGNSLILLNGEMKGTTAGGQLRLSGIRPGTYTIVARKEGYADKSEYITIKRGMNPDRKIVLHPAQAPLIVRANQPGVRIFLDGKDSGSVTGADGSATVASVPAGRHSLILSKEGFFEWKENRDFAVNRTTEINISLKPLEIPPNVAVLRITSDPTEASVVVRGIGGGKQGTTSGGSLTLQGLKPGTVKVLVESDGYEKKEMSIALAAGRAVTQHFVLIPKPAVLQLATTPPVTDALVKIDSLEVGRTDRSGVLRMTVQPGKSQVIEVTREGFERDVRPVEFRPGKTVDLRISLIPRASIPSTATLSVSSAPAEAEVFVDDKRVGLTPTDMLQVAPGRHKITLKKEGYRDKEAIFEFRAGEPRPLSYPLEKELGRLDISAEPPGVTASIEGQNYNVESKKEILLAPGIYTVQLMKSGYSGQQHKVTILDQQTVPLRVKLSEAAPLTAAYSDDFRDLKNWENEANWRADGFLRAKGVGMVLLKDKVFRNFTQRVQLRLINGTSASLIVRAKDSRNFYLIRLNGDEYWDAGRRKTIGFYLSKEGKETEIGNYALPVEPRKMRQWFEIFIEATDNRFRVKVSGNVLAGRNVPEAQLGTFTDPDNRCPEGTIGFRVSRGEEFEIGVVVIKSSN